MIKKKKKKLGKKRKKLLNEWLLLWYISRKVSVQLPFSSCSSKWVTAVDQLSIIRLLENLVIFLIHFEVLIVVTGG